MTVTSHIRPALRRMLVGASVLTAICTTAHGAGSVAVWPNKVIKLIIPFPPGQTSSDVFGRALAEKLGPALGQTVVVENRPGAGGTVGADQVAKAPADGYTLLLAANGTITIAPSVYGAKMPFDPQKDLQPVSLFALVPYMLVAPPSVTATTAQEFISLAKAQPGILNFVSSGNGTTPHLCGEWFKRQAGIDIMHVPYKGGSVATADLLAGRVHLYCAGGPSTFGYLKSGKLRALGLTSAKRSPVLPNIPTLAEQGVRGMDDINSWVGVFAPAKTPAPVVQRLYAEIAKIMATPEMRELVAGQAAEPMALTPVQFAARIKEETAHWSRVVETIGVSIN
ncbi:Bug family tripartite tricarboxylate transporter substrate binding protein [Roseateles toxinivorans]|uniref:Tripartite-type tricarboxylate transporter receptor subunit TctC n=1 Tax=Roseateles toxinivorans TaxID=270368 RepID=A0A4V3CSU8_9BURK|nr:tripartite tricarboxylate transporter substrate binding protein [Roseateles toxinivorans]TDP62064.1 tripartite-type tricarboxylate transporter receptor subunit TctC [Roseateles toxinivorans]